MYTGIIILNNSKICYFTAYKYRVVTLPQHAINTMHFTHEYMLCLREETTLTREETTLTIYSDGAINSMVADLISGLRSGDPYDLVTGSKLNSSGTEKIKTCVSVNYLPSNANKSI